MRLQIAVPRILIASVLLGLGGDGLVFAEVAPSNTVNAQAGNLHPVKQADKWGYADASGRMVIAPEFKDARPFSEGLAAVYVEINPPSKIGFIDSRGVRTSKPAQRKWGFIGQDGTMVIPPQFEAVRDFSEGLAAAKLAQRKWGFIGQDGTMVIPPQFEAVGDFSEGLAAASLAVRRSDSDTWGYIDRQGKMVIKPQFSYAGPFSEGLALVNAGGVCLTDPFVRSFVNIGFIDKSGHWFIRSKFKYFFYDDFSNGLVAFRKNFGKWGYMDKGGKTVIKPQFDWAGRFLGDGLAAVVVNGKCAHIDKSGRVVGQPEPLKAPWGEGKLARRVRTFTFNPNRPPCS
jgi:hypothetical protein